MKNRLPPPLHSSFKTPSKSSHNLPSSTNVSARSNQYFPSTRRTTPAREFIKDRRFSQKHITNQPFDPKKYVTKDLTIDDILDIKEVFDTYDSTCRGVLIPSDLHLFLTQNGYEPNHETLYGIIGQLDEEEDGGIKFEQFVRALSFRPHLHETKKQIHNVFRQYDLHHKGYISLQDLKEINMKVKEFLDKETLEMVFKAADENQDGKISYQEFYEIMTRRIYA